MNVGFFLLDSRRREDEPDESPAPLELLAPP